MPGASCYGLDKTGGLHYSEYLLTKMTVQTKKTRARRMSGPERRAQIVRVATGLFIQRGFKGTTTREIARKAGISEAVIFKHFRRKEDLYSAIIASKCDDGFGESRLLAVIKGKKGRELFLSLAGFLITEHRSDPSFMRLLTYSALEKHDLSEMFIRTRGIELFEFLEERIKEMIESGTIRKVDPQLAARAFLGMVLHYSLAQEIYGLKKYYEWDDDHVAGAFVDIFFDGVKRR